MDLSELESVIRDAADSWDGEPGAWEFEVQGVRLACLADLRYDRVRLIAPIIEEHEMSERHRRDVLEANFHTALDARYATSDGVLYAAFLHPLSSLDESLAQSAIEQVVNLVATFGGSYSGGTIMFSRPGDPEPELN